MTAPTPTPPEEFRADWKQTWSATFKPLLVSYIMILLLLWVLGYLAGGPIVSVVLPVAVVGGLVALGRWSSHAQGVRMSRNGVEFLRRDGTVLRMRWRDVQGIERLSRKGLRLPGVDTGGAAVNTSAAMFTQANSGPGLVGLTEKLSAAEAATERDKPDWTPHREPTLMAFHLVMIDQRWWRSRIGSWVRGYRPDLLK